MGVSLCGRSVTRLPLAGRRLPAQIPSTPTDHRVSLRGAQRRSHLNPRPGRLLPYALKEGGIQDWGAASSAPCRWSSCRGHPARAVSRASCPRIAGKMPATHEGGTPSTPPPPRAAPLTMPPGSPLSSGHQPRSGSAIRTDMGASPGALCHRVEASRQAEEKPVPRSTGILPVFFRSVSLAYDAGGPKAINSAVAGAEPRHSIPALHSMFSPCNRSTKPQTYMRV